VGAIPTSAVGQMLETPCIRRYYLLPHPKRGVAVRSDNASGADNQQERPGVVQWPVSFVDGEECFRVAISRNPT